MKGVINFGVAFGVEAVSHTLLAQTDLLRGHSYISFVIAVVFAVIAYKILSKLTRKPQPVQGWVFVTGADSGMGEATAVHLAKLGYNVFAGCFLPDSASKLTSQLTGASKPGKLIVVPLDVTQDSSVAAAVKTVQQQLGSSDPHGLIALINCAGLGFTGPAEYFPMEMYQKQMDVNFFGYLRTMQAFLPLIREATDRPGARRGRLIFIGTGGGVPSPSPPLLSAYMASKWAMEATCQTLRLELKLTGKHIDCCMINPGFVKPTGLMAGGLALIEQLWKKTPARAKDEYGWMMDRFLEFSKAQTGTHVSFVAFAMEEAMRAERPWLRYQVGPDSKVSPIVGLLPTSWREKLLAKSMYNLTPYPEGVKPDM